MFWGVACEAGKKYSQVVHEAFRITMASLETKEKLPDVRHVSLMVEHKSVEFLLCTLEYDKTMQVNMDLCFNIGERITFFVNGDGIIHMTGYLLDIPKLSYSREIDGRSYGSSGVIAVPAEDPCPEVENDWSADEMFVKRTLRSKNQYMKFDRNSLIANNMVTVSDEGTDDSEDKDYVLGDFEEEEGIEYYDDTDVSTTESDDDDEEENDDDDDDITGKRKMAMQDGNQAKKSKNDLLEKKSDIANLEDVDANMFKVDKSKIYEPPAVESYKEQSEVAVDLDSSIGRTPMPHKKLALLKKARSHSVGDMALKENRFSEKDNVMSEGKKTAFQKPKKFENKCADITKYDFHKLSGGVEIEDVKLGSGPKAKSGSFVHIFYVGKLLNNKVFDSCGPDQKAFSFRLGRNEVVKGLDIGMEGMRAGGRRVIKIPSHLGYGKRQEGCIPPNSTLLFTIDLKSAKH